TKGTDIVGIGKGKIGDIPPLLLSFLFVPPRQKSNFSRRIKRWIEFGPGDQITLDSMSR
ncbi:hypothetical protein NPIL_415151, partial [Nephila pilipes]